MMFGRTLVAVALILSMGRVWAESAPSTAGTVVAVQAKGEVRHANEMATVYFFVEEFHKDKTMAADRVNRKMKEGTAIVRRMDAGAQLETYGYSTSAVYSEAPEGVRNFKPELLGWRVRHCLSVTTEDLAGLPQMAGAAQQAMGISSVYFYLSEATRTKLDAERIAVAYRNLNARIASIARAMGRQPADAVVESLDFEGAGRHGGDRERMYAPPPPPDDSEDSEPSFEPGSTTLSLSVVGKVRFM